MSCFTRAIRLLRLRRNPRPRRSGGESNPLATYTGWGLRAAAPLQPTPIIDGCDATGQRIAFAPTAASRLPGGSNAGDPRRSLAERYTPTTPTAPSDYVAKIQAAAARLQDRRLMLPADAASYVAAAAGVSIP